MESRMMEPPSFQIISWLFSPLIISPTFVFGVGLSIHAKLPSWIVLTSIRRPLTLSPNISSLTSSLNSSNASFVDPIAIVRKERQENTLSRVSIVWIKSEASFSRKTEHKQPYSNRAQEQSVAFLEAVFAIPWMMTTM